MTEPSRSTSYQLFVDGLRAVAILAVLGFHVDARSLPGGFVGVDVFFVISGYLIIGQLDTAIETGRHSLVEFWARRVLRILPPYLLVIVASLALAPWVLATASERYDFGSQVLWSAGMLANQYFLAQQGYFDTSADTKPFLHLWSLAVEEQFYLVAPLVMSAFWLAKRRATSRAARRFVVFGVPSGLFLLSLLACWRFTGSGEGPNQAFFLMPLRAWEFIAGGCLPWVARSLGSRGPRGGDALAVAGLGAIGLSAATFSEQMPFPSYTALLPVLGSCLVILAGSINERAFLVRMLASRPLTMVGVVSYSWYLWHWPLLAFVRISNFGERNLRDDALAAAASLILSILTYRFIERPIRVWRQTTRPRLTWRTTAVGLAACCTVAGAGLAERPAVALTEAEAEAEADENRKKGGVCDFTAGNTFQACARSVGNNRLGLVAGDSHASGVFRFLTGSHEVPRTVVSRSTSRNCSPILGTVPAVSKDPAWDERCSKRKGALQAALDADQYGPEFVVFSARWIAYTKGGPHPLVPISKKAAGDADQIFESELRATLQRFLAHGTQRILLVGPTPELPRPAPECAAQAQRQHQDTNVACAASADSLKRARRALKLVKRAASGLPGVKVLDALPSLCDDRICPAADGEELRFLDKDHLSEAGFTRLYEHNRRLFHWVLGSELRARPATVH